MKALAHIIVTRCSSDIQEYKGKQAEGKGNAGVFLPYLARLQQRGEAPSNIVKRTAAATKGRQLDVKVVPGETALSFFTATNKSDKAITGVATYNVHPPKVGLYFNKIQCFCFEEQRLLPGETVDMPVFFFIDPEIMDHPGLKHVNNVTLSYTFFQTDMDD